MKRTITLVALSFLLALFAGFALARVTRPESQSATRAPTSSPVAANEVLGQWLGLNATQSRQLQQLDASFPKDYSRLRQDLQTRRSELAQAIEDPKSSDALIRGRVDAAIEADHALERRITEHLLTVRQQLTPEQQQRLFSLAAEGIRRGGGYCRNLFGTTPGCGVGQGMGRHRMMMRGQSEPQ
jgi:Spy/CpxP family protein refolding chaperone